jgi:hypothetical protein
MHGRLVRGSVAAPKTQVAACRASFLVFLVGLVFVWACGNRQQAPSDTGGAAPGGAPDTGQAAPAAAPAEPPLFSLSSTVEVAGLRQGVSVLTRPEGQAEQRSESATIAITCYATTPADEVKTWRRWDTVLRIDEPGRYRFRLTTDDDGTLAIAGTKLLTTPTLNARLVNVDFKKTGGYRLTVEVLNNIGAYCADLTWARGASDDFVPIPADRFYLPR